MSGKHKISKSVSSRLKVTKRGKIFRRLVGQGHFKAKDPGKMTRIKRKLVVTEHPILKKALKKYLSPISQKA